MAPIHNAALRGNLNRVKALLDQGVPVNARNELPYLGYTPLHHAAFGGHVNVVQELLRRGAHVNPRTFRGRTPLHLAASGSRPRVIHALLKAGANPTYRNMNGWVPSSYRATAVRNAVSTSRAASKWIKKTQNAANKRRMNAARQVLGSVPVREGGSTRKGLPNNILRLIGSKMRRN